MTATWDRALLAIESKVAATTFNRWFRPLSVRELGRRDFNVVADTDFDALFIERNFAETIRLYLEREVGDSVRLSITSDRAALGGAAGTHRETRLAMGPDQNDEPPVPKSLLPRPSLTPPANGHTSPVVSDSLGRAQSGATPSRDGLEELQPRLRIESVRPSLTERIMASGLKLQYAFEEFVVGPANEFAHAAAVAVQQKPGRTYNPLFLHGSVGLGKTHLLNAIGIELLRGNPDCRVRYMTTESFVNDVVANILTNNMPAFRNRLRDNVDVLLLDDIQFISGKDACQQELFHTFNTLHHQVGAQIVLTSDRYPKAIPDIEERLQSRFSWGLIVEINPPDIETRMAIVRKKAQSLDLDLPDEAVLFLAENIRSNVRELEGALLRLHAFAGFNGKVVTLDLVRTLLRQFFHENNRQVTVEAVHKAVCTYFNVKLADLKGPGRQRALSYPRQVAMYLAKRYTGLSYPQLGEKFGGRDHTTILSGCRKIEELLGSDKTVAAAVQSLEKQLTRQ